MAVYFALVKEAAAFSKSVGAKFAVTVNFDQGYFEWLKFWCQAAPTEGRLENHLRSVNTVRDFARENGIDFIGNVHPIIRARNDTHPNADGNEAIAENFYLHLMGNHRQAMMDRR